MYWHVCLCICVHDLGCFGLCIVCIMYVFACIYMYMHIYICICVYVLIEKADMTFCQPEGLLAAFMTMCDWNLEAGVWWA